MNTPKFILAIIITLVGLAGLLYSLYYLKYWRGESSSRKGYHVIFIIISVLILGWGIHMIMNSRKEKFCSSCATKGNCACTSQGYCECAKENYCPCGKDDGEGPRKIINGGNYVLYNSGFGTHSYNVTDMEGIPFQPYIEQNAGLYECNKC